MQKHNDWLFIAEQDINGAKKLISGADAVVPPAIFLTQQCAEKALKGYLIFKGQKIVRTHDLLLLVKQCSNFDKEFLDLSEIAIQLNPYLTESRYPDDNFVLPDIATVEIAIKYAGQILEFVKSKID